MTRRIDASFGVQTAYTLRSVLNDLVKRKFGTLLTILVIAVSLTIPTVSYLLWKNLHLATTQFYPESELTIYLHKNLSEEDANLVVEKIRQQEGVESLNYVSRQDSLKEFKSWSGFGEELEILDDNPLPAVVMVKPSDPNSYQSSLGFFVTLGEYNGAYGYSLRLKGLEENINANAEDRAIVKDLSIREIFVSPLLLIKKI